MKYTIVLFSFLMVFSYNGYADSVMSSDENSSDVGKQESVDPQEESSFNEYASEDITTFRVEERPDGHAPIGIMGDHVHEQGEVMLSLQIMMMRMKYESLKIRHLLPPGEAIPLPLPAVSRNVNMWMGMLGLMYGLTNRWTAMAMVPYSLYNVSGGEIDHGFGDISLSVLYAPLKENSYRVVLSLEAFFPTGFDNHMSGVMKENRNGSAIGHRSAYAFLPKLSTLFYWDQLSLGFQIGFKYSFNADRLREFEHIIEPTAHIWGAYNLSENFSMSLRGTYQGYLSLLSEEETYPGLPDTRHSVLSYLGLNFIGTDFLKGHRLAFEMGLPVYRNVKKEVSIILALGWQRAFN